MNNSCQTFMIVPCMANPAVLAASPALFGSNASTEQRFWGSLSPPNWLLLFCAQVA